MSSLSIFQTASEISHQEPGTRPACTLPYELHANGAISPDGKQFVLELVAANKLFGKRAAGAPFNIYLRNLATGPSVQASTYAVKAGDVLRPSFPIAQFKDGHYEIEVHAPNGFYRRFAGSVEDSVCVLSTAFANQKLQLLLANKSNSTQSITITDNSYSGSPIVKRLRAGSESIIDISLDQSNNWYDRTINRIGSNATIRLAGRVETGHPTTTDPYMATAG